MVVFGDYSKYYDALYATKAYEKEVDYVHRLVQSHSRIEVNSILELGSGTGKHAYFLSKKGYQIEGVDQSATMLEVAGQFLQTVTLQESQNIALSQGDIRTLRTGKCYDAVIALFHVMSYQTTNADLRAVFETVKMHLRPGGVFVFDVWYGPAVLTQRPMVRYQIFESVEGIIERVAVPTLNENNNTVNVHYHLFFQENASNNYHKIEEQHNMRYLFLPEIQALCEEYSMELRHAEEWLTGRALADDTWGACFVVRR